MKRGDIVIVYIENDNATGSEWNKSRPAVVVSNNYCNTFSPVIEVVYLTTKPRKKPLPTHVSISSTPLGCVATCEAVYSVDKSRIMETVHECTLKEMLEINKALAISLGLI